MRVFLPTNLESHD